MCDQCFLKGVYSFKDETNFNDFEAELSRKTNDGTLTLVEEERPYRTLKVRVYRCSNCNAEWYLSLPVRDSIRPNWFGFFLQKGEAEPYIDLLIIKARKKAFLLSSVVVVVLILALLIHALYFK